MTAMSLPPLIGVLITSCDGFAPSTLPPLLASLAEAGVPPDAVRVVVGDCAEASDGAWPGGQLVHRRRTAMLDNNGLAWLASDPASAAWAADWVLYLHDTCRVHPRLWTRLRRAVDACAAGAADCARLRAAHSMGMGLYRVAWVRGAAARARLAGMHTEDVAGRPALKQRLEALEDTLFKLAESGAGSVVVLQEECELEDTRLCAYGTGTRRRVEYYAVPGVYKLKANWGQGGLRLCL